MSEIFVDGKMYQTEKLSIEELKELKVELEKKEEIIRKKIETILQ